MSWIKDTGSDLTELSAASVDWVREEKSPERNVFKLFTVKALSKRLLEFPRCFNTLFVVDSFGIRNVL